jgi:hypothetical protein
MLSSRCVTFVQAVQWIRASSNHRRVSIALDDSVEEADCPCKVLKKDYVMRECWASLASAYFHGEKWSETRVWGTTAVSPNPDIQVRAINSETSS